VGRRSASACPTRQKTESTQRASRAGGGAQPRNPTPALVQRRQRCLAGGGVVACSADLLCPWPTRPPGLHAELGHETRPFSPSCRVTQPVLSPVVLYRRRLPACLPASACGALDISPSPSPPASSPSPLPLPSPHHLKPLSLDPRRPHAAARVPGDLRPLATLLC
jgi:hypothetical protein